MHVQVVNFGLVGVDEAGYVALCDELAPAFAAVPGLLTKVWLADSEAGVYGGVYVWASRAAMEAFAGGDLFAAMVSHPNLADLTRVTGACSRARPRSRIRWWQRLPRAEAGEGGSRGPSAR
jgi:Putative mono-oxygenase ydhR